MNLSQRMKNYEAKMGFVVQPNQPFLIRLDGQAFHTLTQKYCVKPFDQDFHQAMVTTLNAAVQHFQARTGYTHSDEITLIFDRANPLDPVHPFKGRILKLATLSASFCAVIFTTAFRSLKDSKLIPPACFDARVLQFPEDHEIINHMLWRSRFDCSRNAVATMARYHLGHQRIQGLKKAAMIALLGDQWETLPLVFKQGCWCKLKAGQPVNFTFPLSFELSLLEFLLAKEWDWEFFLDNTIPVEILDPK